MTMSRQEHTRNDQEQARTSEEAVDGWWSKLRWSASNHGWIAKTGEVTIFISEQMYEQHLKKFLAEQGIERKTWSQIMHAAEDEWQRQCAVVDRFQKNLDYWLKSNDRGVRVYEHRERVKVNSDEFSIR